MQLKMLLKNELFNLFKDLLIYILKPHWRNRIARSPSKREAAGSSPAWGIWVDCSSILIQI